MSTHAPHEKHDHPEHGHSHSDEACCATSHATEPVRSAVICGTGCCAGDPSGNISSLQPDKPTLSGDGVQTQIRIMQMDCPTEEALLRKKLGDMAEVAGMEFNLMQRVLTVRHEAEAIDGILAAIRSLGFTPELAEETSATTGLTPEPAKPLVRKGRQGKQDLFDSSV